MASVKLKFRPSTVAGNEGSLFYQVIHRRVVRHIKTPYRIMEYEWDESNETVISGINDNARFGQLKAIHKRIQWDKKRLNMIISQLSINGDDYSVDSILELFNEQLCESTLYNYMELLISRLKKNGQIRTSETYISTLNSFIKFRNGMDLYFVEFDSELMLSYEYFLKKEGVSLNTVSFYMRRLRAVYNRAVDAGLTEHNNPFRRVHISSGKTIKRAISLKYIKRLKMLDLSCSASKRFARDMFLFSFYTRGMSFIDIAYLQKSNLRNGMLSYRRRKTGQSLHICWEACMQDLCELYKSEYSSPYLLPIIRNLEEDPRKQYHNALTMINRNLKEIGKMIGLSTPLTMYCARHSWASIAHNEGVPVSIISEGMGHDSETTTQIYLSSLDTSAIDKANKKILKLL